MDAYVLDKYYNTIAVIDTYSSFIWTERVRETGDFEIYAPFSIQAYSALKKENYISIKDSDTYMVIETVDSRWSPDYGLMLTVTGRCLKSIFDRRIVWKPTILKGNMQDAIEKILNENVINPEDERRKIPNVTFTKSTDPDIIKMETDTVFYGESVFDTIRLLCAYHSIGWKVLPASGGGFEIQLLKGIDRSYEQDKLPWVVFSTKYENLFSTHLYDSNVNVKTVALVVDDSVDEANVITVEATNQNGGGTGLERRETFVETYGVTLDEETGEELSTAEREKHLLSKGEETLSETEDVAYVEGEIDARRQFVYGRDFNLGDIVQVDTDFGMDMRCRIMEVIRCQDDQKGYTITPTFETI